MKTKIHKILGVALALVLVLGLFAVLVPARDAEAQAYTPNRWNVLSIPSPGGMGLNPGGEVTDFAVAADGATTYVVDGALGAVYKSTNGGRSFSPLTIPAVVGTLTAIAVSPDNLDAVAYVDDAGAAADIVYVSSNGGATWSTMGSPAPAAATIADIVVSQARVGTLLGRDYAVCTFNPAGGTFGDIYVIGTTATWAAVASGAGLALDFTSVELAPNWTGDRVVLGVGSDGAAGGNAERGGAGDSFLVAINVATGGVSAPGPVRLDAAGGCDSPCEVGGGAAAIVSSSITLPADFDSTSVGNFRAYVGWTSTLVGTVIVCADDAYRVDFNAVRKLEVRPAVGIQSLSYFGTVGTGTLVVGESASNGVWFSSDPMSGMPTWGAGSAKPPTGATNTIVAMASDTDVYAGTSGANAGFHKSLDGGLSFNGYSLIDAAIAAIDDVMPSPDGSTIFMATSDAAGDSLWRGVGFPNPGSWERVHFRTPAQFPGASTALRLSPDYADDSSLYWFDIGVGAGTVIRRSTSGGQIWGGRTAPVAVQDATIESQDVLYIINGTSVYASTNGGWFFGLPTDAGIGPLYSIAMAPSYPAVPLAGNILVGATAASGGVCLSTDANASYRPLLSFIGGASDVQVYADENFASNSLVYAGDNTAGSGIWRYEVGASNAWENIHGVTGQMTGLAQHGGVLYGSWDDAVAVTSGVERSLLPFVPSYAAAFFDSMTVGVGAARFDTTPSALRVAGTDTETSLWAIDTAGTGALVAYQDEMAKAAPSVTVPAEVPFDSVVGGSSRFTVSWTNISNALFWEVEICSDPGCAEFVFGTGAAYMPPFPPGPTWVVAPGTLSAGKDYFLHVRCRDQMPGDGIRSQWSSVQRFSIQAGERVTVSYLGVQPLGPVPGATGVPLSPGFTWSPYASSTRYEFQLASDAGFGDILAEAKVAATGYKYDGTLANATTYFWRARGIEPTVSDWSPMSSFTTEKVTVPPVVVEPTPLAPTPEPSALTPAVIWAIIAIGAILVIAVIVLIVRTRRTV